MRTSGRFQWDELPSLALPSKKITALTGLSAVLILANAPFYNDRRFWMNGDKPVNDAEWDDISHALAEMEDEIMGNMVGMILTHALGSIANLELLACDGSSYLREDYPRLYEAIDPVFIIDADTFTVPDLRDKFPMAEGVDFSVGDSGGEKNHLLKIDEMPLHSHTNTPHSHTEITAVPSLADFGTGAPVPSATPSVGVTSAESIAIQNTGGNEPHNNMPPFLALKWAIVAG